MDVQVERLHRVKPLAPVSFFEETARREKRQETHEARKPLRGTESDAYSVEISAAGRRAAAHSETGGMMVEGF
ncbi:cell division protein ZipA [uncultured Selenomonas sp.]|uniref:cell division protein ZipA n=1 Tax=uncultured Selenomonas sp. TaxID=159275 RepID=UPI0026273C1E|nr:cell division protein ZipA [uncultured Selenomonas sp.]